MNASVPRLHAMTRRRQILGFAGAAAIVSMVGCGGSDSEDTAGSDTPARTSPTPVPRPKIPHHGSMATAELGAGARLNGAACFPVGSTWNRDVSSAPVESNSTSLIAGMGLHGGPRCDLGAGSGIPYVVVAGTQRRVAIRFAFPEQSDVDAYPMPDDAPIESGFDRRVLVIDRDNNQLFELYGASVRPGGGWNAGSGAIFQLDSDDIRPGALPGWMSADPSGMPIFPGLIRYEEARAGLIPHALRFAAPQTRRAYVAPATSWGMALSDDAQLPPMGVRLRLAARFVIPEGFSRESRAILQALKTYGMFLAETTSKWGFTGAPDERWDGDRIVGELDTLRSSDFEVVAMEDLVTG